VLVKSIAKRSPPMQKITRECRVLNLRGMYGTPERVSHEWGAGKFANWDDTAGLWNETRLMIAHTSTDGAFDAAAVAGFEAKYGNIARLNQAWDEPARPARGSKIAPPEMGTPDVCRARCARGSKAG